MIPNDTARCRGNTDAEGYTDRQCERCLRRLALVEDLGKPFMQRSERMVHIEPVKQWPCPNRIEAK